MPRPMIAIGEAMVELAPLGQGMYRRGFAGDTFNTAWHLKQLLGDRADAGFVTRVGSDKLSTEFLNLLATDGLDASVVSRDQARSMGLYLIELDGVERSFHYWRGQSAARLLADDEASLARIMKGRKLIHLSGITLAILSPEARSKLLAAISQARSSGSLVSFDSNIRPKLWASASEMQTALSAMLRLTDIALPSFDDEHAHWNDATPADTMQRLRAQGVREGVIKNAGGPLQAFSAADDERIYETPKVSNIRDTTGAGDAFNAGYLAARLMGGSQETAVTLAQQLAALVLQHLGARAPKDAVAELGRRFPVPEGT